MSKRQVILGLKPPSQFTIEERKLIIEEYLQTGVTKREIWRKYTGREKEKGHLIRWMRQLGYDLPPKWGKLSHRNSASMPKQKPEQSIENIQLKEKLLNWRRLWFSPN